jgi:hypothetical protein
MNEAIVINNVQFPNRFESFRHYEEIFAWLRGSNQFESVTVTAPLTNVGLSEHWFRNLPTGDILKIVEPDGPFRGIIEVMRAESLR